MAYLNKVMLIGNIGKDPAIVTGANGRKRVSFSLATSRRYRDNNGEQKEETHWHNIVAWGKTVDIIEQLGVKKGTTLYVEGVLTNRSWTDQNGQQKYSTEVNMESFQLLSSRQGDGSQMSNGGRNPYSQSNNSAQSANGSNPFQNNNTEFDGGEEDGLPF